MNLRRIAPLVLTFLSLAFPAAARVNEMNPRPVAAPTAETQRQAPRTAAAPERARGSRADEQRYAERQKASKNAKKFRAGEAVVVISATAAIIILLGVIIILLIT